MHSEILAATNFLAKYVPNATESQHLKQTLPALLLKKYANYWNPTYPLQGNALRALTPSTDSIFAQTGIQNVNSYFPRDLILWVDPMDVSFRIGDYGYVTSIYNGGDVVGVMASPPRVGSSPLRLSPPLRGSQVYQHVDLVGAVDYPIYVS